MSSSYDIEILIGGIAILAVYGYATFWAFNIRKGLTVKLYRNQALGIGLVGIGLVYFSFVFDNLINFVVPAGGISDAIGFGALFFATLPLFYWTDQSLQAARQSDPLERDQFHWSKVRKILWIVLCAGLITDVSFDTVTAIVCTFPTLSSKSYSCPGPGVFAPPGPFGLFDILGIGFIFAIFGIPLASSAILLPFAWRKSNDITFRRHLKWFALAAISLGFSFSGLLLSITLNNAFVSSGIQDALFLLSGYFLYRSARAVIPLYTFKEEIRAK
jgi:hypothetical protein